MPIETVSTGRSARRALGWAGGAVLLVAAAVIVPFVLGDEFRKTLVAESAPLFGVFEAHVGPGTVPAVVIAIAVVLWGPPWPAACPSAGARRCRRSSCSAGR